MKFGGIGVPELLIILAVVLLIFGPKNLPKLGSAIGRTVKNLREGMNSAPISRSMKTTRRPKRTPTKRKRPKKSPSARS